MNSVAINMPARLHRWPGVDYHLSANAMIDMGHFGHLDCGDQARSLLASLHRQLDLRVRMVLVRHAVQQLATVVDEDADLVLSSLGEATRSMQHFHRIRRLYRPCSDETFGDVAFSALASGVPMSALNFEPMGGGRGGQPMQRGIRAGDVFLLLWFDADRARLS